MNWFEEKQAARKERMEARAERKAAEGRAKYDSGFERLRSIPFGQPILVGHYSEGRDRNFRRKAVGAIDKGCELMREAEQIEARAASVGTGGVSSDDPDAVRKLKEQLAELETSHANEKRWNAQFRKGGIDALDAPENIKAAIANTMRVCTYLREPFLLSNNTANIRRVKQRIEFLSRQQTRETTETQCEGFKVIQNTEINRLQFVFPGKPSEKVRAVLKSSGFRWSPTEGAWQRQLTSCPTWRIEQLTKELQEVK